MCAWTLTWRIKRTLETMKAFHSGKSRNDEARKQERVFNYLDLTRTYSEYSCIQMQRWKDRTRPKARNLCCGADINVKRYKVESHEKNLFFFVLLQKHHGTNNGACPKQTTRFFIRYSCRQMSQIVSQIVRCTLWFRQSSQEICC